MKQKDRWVTALVTGVVFVILIATLSPVAYETIGALIPTVRAYFPVSSLVGTMPPYSFVPEGVSGGGASYAPSISPHNSDEIIVLSDMKPMLRTTNNGASWSLINNHEIVPNNLVSKVRYTSDENTLYSIHLFDATYKHVVRKSVDGGATWNDLPTDPTPSLSTASLNVHPNSTNRLIISDDHNVYYSADAGENWQTAYTQQGDGYLYVGDAFWDGDNVYLGTNQGLLVSTDGGDTFVVDNATGIPVDKGIFRMAGAKVGNTTRLMVTTATASELLPFFYPDESAAIDGKVYKYDVGQGNWTEVFSDSTAQIINVTCSPNDINTFYFGGAGEDSLMIYKTTDGGSSWSALFNETSNGNIQTGYAGDGGYFDWGWEGITLGLGVDPNDVDHVMITGMGFSHISNDGGANWRAAYVDETSLNPAGAEITPGSDYKMNGYNVTVLWDVFWANQDNIIAGYTDIGGWHSDDAGVTWSKTNQMWDDNGYDATYNTVYQSIKHPENNTIYSAVGDLHNLYLGYSGAIEDGATILDTPGEIMYSVDNGADWNTLYNFNKTVVSIAIDPNVPDVMYAAVVGETGGGIYKTTNLSAGAAASWTLLPHPSRAERHPYQIRVLNDGALVVSYSIKLVDDETTATSGIFVSADGGNSWEERSEPGMYYWTKDIVIDPHDASQDTWYAAVCAYDIEPTDVSVGKEGLYKTTDRGKTWTKIWSDVKVESVTIHPTDPDLMYISTYQQGLWFTDDLNGSFDPQKVVAYPFMHPIRTFINPYDDEDIWVVSNGAGILRGNTGELGTSRIYLPMMMKKIPIGLNIKLSFPSTQWLQFTHL